MLERPRFFTKNAKSVTDWMSSEKPGVGGANPPIPTFAPFV